MSESKTLAKKSPATSGGGKLRNRILDEMVVDYSSTLEKHFDSAKRFVSITKQGAVEVSVKDKVLGRYQVLLYLIGKLYSKEAGLVDSEEVGNAELLERLGLPEGSLHPLLKQLREEGKIIQTKRENNVYHSILPGQIGSTLGFVESSIKDGNLSESTKKAIRQPRKHAE